MRPYIVYSMPCELIVGSIAELFELEHMPVIVAAGFDKDNNCVNVAMNINDIDLQALGMSVEDLQRVEFEAEFEDGELIQ